MHRLELALPLLAALAVACADDSTAMTSGTGTTTTTSAATSDDPSTVTEVGPVTTPVPGTTPGTTSTTTDPTAGTTGEPGVCGVAGDSLRADLFDVDAPPSTSCDPLEFTGRRVSGPKGPSWQLDTCPCGGNCLVPDPWTFNVEAPAEWLPLMPACPRIVVERVEELGGCRFAAVSIWDLEAPGEPAVYHAGHGLAPTAAAAPELSITPNSIATCECPGCCATSQLWDLQFSFAGQQLTLAEGESGAVGKHNLKNFQSHHPGICDAPPAVHWAIRRSP